MRVILQSPYLTLEYLIWRHQNGLWQYDSNQLKKIKVSVANFNSRNLLSLIELPNGEKYILKQYGSETKYSFVKNEIKFLSFMNQNLKPYVPEILFSDEYNGIIASKLIRNSINSMDYFGTLRDSDNFDSIGITVNEIAEIFNKIHSLDVSKSAFERVDVNKIIKFDTFPKEPSVLKDLMFFYESWPKKAKLVHFDSRLENFLIVDNKDLKILDWEFALLGDPIWDISIFIISLCYTLSSTGFFSNTAQIDKIRPIVQNFCKAYFKNNTSYKETLKTYMRLQLYANGNENVTQYTTTIDNLID